MNRRIVGFFAILVIGTGAMIAWRFLAPRLKDKFQTESSDAVATKGRLTVAVDSWIGYFPLCGKEMRRQLRTAGYLLACEDDKANLKDRFAKIANGSHDFAVATVDSLLTNGAAEDFPGVIVAVIDESRGGDAIVARKDKVNSLDQLKGPNPFRIAYTPSSPSEYFLTAVGVHFDIARLLKRGEPWRVETDGSEAAFKQLSKGDVDVAVLWEPDVSRAIASEGLVKLLSTKDAARLIVDVLVVRRQFAQENPSAVHDFLSAYFKALKAYRDDPGGLKDEVMQATKLSSDQVDAMLGGVQWYNLLQNARDWFGLGGTDATGEEGLVDIIESTAKILVESGTMSRSPVPAGDPYRLQNRSFIEQLYSVGIGIPGTTDRRDETLSPAASLAAPFPELDAAAWGKLTEIGTLKVRPISFQSGTAELSDEGRGELDLAAESLGHFPNFRVVIKGHTGLGGDIDANRELSQRRAESVKNYLVEARGVSPPRLNALGMGASAPLARGIGETDRAYNYRLPRVELYLVSDVY